MTSNFLLNQKISWYLALKLKLRPQLCAGMIKADSVLINWNLFDIYLLINTFLFLFGEKEMVSAGHHFKFNFLDFGFYFCNPFATISATSNTCTLLSTPLSFSPSANIVMQYGQATQTVLGSFFNASSVRSILIRLPRLSSSHILPPPAPQQKPRLWFRSISSGALPVAALTTARGAS